MRTGIAEAGRALPLSYGLHVIVHCGKSPAARPNASGVARESRDHMRARYAGRPSATSCFADSVCQRARGVRCRGPACESPRPASRARTGRLTSHPAGRPGATALRPALPVPYSLLHHLVCRCPSMRTACPPRTRKGFEASRMPLGRPVAGRQLKSSSAYSSERGHLQPFKYQVPETRIASPMCGRASRARTWPAPAVSGWAWPCDIGTRLPRAHRIWCGNEPVKRERTRAPQAARF